MKLLLALVLSLGCIVANDDAKPKSPNDAVADMAAVLAEKDFKKFYNERCHGHLRMQLNEEEFIEYMQSDAGDAIVNLFHEVLKAIEEGKGLDVLIARHEESPDAYEYILVEVKKSVRRNGEQWHLQLEKEDGVWKLLDTD